MVRFIGMWRKCVLGSLWLVVGLAMASLPATASSYDKELARKELRRADQRAAFEQQQQAPESSRSAAVTTCVDGFAGTYPCSKVDLVAFLPLAQMGGGNGNDIWGWVDPQTQREYAIMGRTSGTSFIDITDPANPVYLGNLPPHGADSYYHLRRIQWALLRALAHRKRSGRGKDAGIRGILVTNRRPAH